MTTDRVIVVATGKTGPSSGGSGGMTAAEILTAIKTVDGAGSGLDADLLDGISSTGFATRSAIWQPLRAYAAGELVEWEGNLYAVDTAFTSPAFFDTVGLTAVGGGGGGGGAPTDATYITTTANGSLSAEVLLSAVIRSPNTYALRPDATTVPAGTLYYATDTNEILRSNGTTWVFYGGGGVLATTQYQAGADTNFTAITSTASTLVDVDATNLAVTFTVPSSGVVLVRLTARSYSPASVNLRWGLKEGSSNVANTEADVAGGTGGGGEERRTHVVRVSGLTPGDVKTWKWGARVSSSTGYVYSGPTYGPAVMEVVTAPF